MRTEVLSRSINWTKRMFPNNLSVTETFSGQCPEKENVSDQYGANTSIRHLKKTNKKKTFLKPFWFWSGSIKQRKTILCFVPVWLMNTFLADTFETTWINNWLEHWLSVGHPANNSCYNLPTTAHPCASKSTNKLEVMKGRQTKSALIAAKSAIFGERIKIKNVCLRSQCMHWWAFDKKLLCKLTGDNWTWRSFPVVHMCHTVIEDVTPHSTLPSCLRVVWPDCHSGTPRRK